MLYVTVTTQPAGCTTAESFSYYRQGQERLFFSTLTLGGTRILVDG